MSLSKRKFWYFSDCLHFSKHAASFQVYFADLFTTILHAYINEALLRFIHRYDGMHIDIADMQRQSIACNRSFYTGLTSAGDWKLECFE